MVADSINLHPSLRPWQRAGLDFLLADAPVPAPCSLCLATPVAAGGRMGAGSAARAAAPSTGGSTPTRPVRPASSPQDSPDYAYPAPESSVGTVTTAQRPPNSQQRPTSQPQPASSARPDNPPDNRAGEPSQASHINQAQSYLPPDAWPAIWRDRLQKTAPASVLWTYWALGEDMCVRPNPARRALLQKMLADLGHPAGTHSFWPAAMPHSLDAASNHTAAAATSPDTVTTDSNAALLYPAPEIFWSGVQHLKARAVVVMGSPALKALELPSRLRPFQQTRHQGTLVVVLRDVDFLAQESQRYDAVKAFLRQALAPFGR